MSDSQCPVCSGKKIIKGRLLLSGADDGWVTRFYPKGLRFFRLRKSVTLSEGQLFRSCLSCGHVWSRLNEHELRELLEHSGDEEVQRLLDSA